MTQLLDEEDIDEAYVECSTDDITAIVRTLPFLNLSKKQAIYVTADQEKLTFTAVSAVKDARVNVWINRQAFYTYDCVGLDEEDDEDEDEAD